MTARILVFEFPIVPTRQRRTDEAHCETCGARGEPEDMLRDRYTEKLHCMRCISEDQLAAGALDVQARLHELEQINEMYKRTLVWIRNDDNCPAHITGKAITALAGMKPVGV